MNNRNTILTIIVLILIMVLSIVALSKDEVVKEEYHKVYNPINELGDLNKYINDNYKLFNRIIINSYLNNNTLDDIEIFDNKNKILFAFEHMFKYKDYDKDFLVLDSKKLETTDKSANDKDVISYMYVTDFKTYYEKLLHEELKLKDREVSSYNTEFDKINLYVYYKNINSKYSTDSIMANKNSIDNNYIITSEITIKLNDALKKKLNKDIIKADIKYTYLENDEIYIYSIKTKTSE